MLIDPNWTLKREGNEDDIDEDEMYLRRLSGGLFTLQVSTLVLHQSTTIFINRKPKNIVF